MALHDQPRFRDSREIYIELGKKIREIRRRHGMKQDTLAEGVDLTRTSLANIEAGRQRTPLHVLYEISRVLGVSIAELLPKDDASDRKMPIDRVLKMVGLKDRAFIVSFKKSRIDRTKVEDRSE